MVKVADLIANVEYVKEGWSDAKPISEWKDTFEKRRKDKEQVAEPISPTREALNKLQDNGLSQKQLDFPEARLVGKA